VCSAVKIILEAWLHYVYVIRSSEGRHYVGSTEDVEKRLKQHNAKSNRGWTNRFTGWHEVYREECKTRLEARRREREIKKKGGWKGIQRRAEKINGPLPSSPKRKKKKKPA
jgi:putative endonuclease